MLRRRFLFSKLQEQESEEENMSILGVPEKKRKWNQAEFTGADTDLWSYWLGNRVFPKQCLANMTKDEEDDENYVGDPQMMTSFSMKRNGPNSKSCGRIKKVQNFTSKMSSLSEPIMPMKQSPIIGKPQNDPFKSNVYRSFLGMTKSKILSSGDDQEQDPKTSFSQPTPVKRFPITREQDSKMTSFPKETSMKRALIIRKPQSESKFDFHRCILSKDDQQQDPKVTGKQKPKSCQRVHYQENEEDMAVESFYEFNKKPIGLGAFGTSVYGGKNQKDGRRVAIKKIHCHTEKQTRQYKREIKYLLKLHGCSNIVNYLDVVIKQDIVYIILELMEGTLESLLSQPEIAIKFPELSQDIINALRFLHTTKIIHRDIKPRNILYVTSPRIMLKLADFGLSKMIESDSSTAGYTGGTRCWMAPELLKSLDQFSFASDVFAAGLVLHYLIAFKHPFAPANVTVNKENRLFVEYQIVHNILSNSPIFDGSISPEALHLINQMLDENKEQRPSADEILGHPFFWTNQKKVKFCETVANQPEICQSHSKHKWASNFGKDLESSLGVEFLTTPWSEFSTSMKFVYDEMMISKKRKYNTSSAVDLLRFIRNAHQHVSDSSRTPSFQQFVLNDHVFFDNFKTLFIEVYKTVRKHKWDSTRPEIKYIS